MTAWELFLFEHPELAEVTEDCRLPLVTDTLERRAQRLRRIGRGTGAVSYTLTATLGHRSESLTLEEEEGDGVLFVAIREILDRAHAEKDGPWALGHVALIDPEGTVIAQMDAK